MEDNMYRLLIIEDDLGIASAVEKQALSWDFSVKCVENFRDVMKEFAGFAPHLVLEDFAREHPQLVILDITLPFYNGYHWCSEIRKVSKVPVIILSSASDNMNIVMAMNMGADDFIAKPFDENVLTAKIQALLRRTYDFGSSVPVIEHRGAILNTGDGTLTFGTEQISLSKNEFKILQCLMENKGKIVSREKLMEKLWKTDVFVDENTLTVNINRLRKKLDAAGLDSFITTKFGMGYIIE